MAEAVEKKVIVNVAGVDDDVAENIRSYVGVSNNSCSTAIDLLKQTEQKTIAEANKALQAFGYYDADVAVDFIAVDDCSEANIAVIPGRPMPVEAVSVSILGPASDDQEFMQSIRALPLKKGETLNHGAYSSSKSRIESLAAELGYLDGRFTKNTLSIDMQSYQASASLVYESGQRYTLGKLLIDQQPYFLQEDLIHRLIEAPEETRQYRASDVIDIQSRLQGSGYFKRVETRPRLSKTENQAIPVDVKLYASDRHQFLTSFGYATDEGARAKLSYANRWWNQRGHRLGADVKLSQTAQGLSANYQIPRQYPANEWLQFTASFREQEVDTFDSSSARFAVSETKRRPWGFLENRFVSISRDDFEIGNESGIATFLIPGIRWSRRLVDDEFFPRQGLNVNFEIRGASDFILADTNLLRSNISVNYLQSLPLDFRAYLRSELGAMWVDKFRALPPSERFFAGGDNSIRGYDFQDLGPVNAQGFVIGGQTLAVVSLELERYFTQNWGGALFIDTGNAFGGPGSDTGLKTGVGLGLRWRSPVGPVRIDLAHPLDDDDTLLKLHLRIGPGL